MDTLKEHYRIDDLPIFQNKTFWKFEEAVNFPKADMVLVQDLKTGLIFNSSFDSDLLEYDSEYQNEQAVSPRFCDHLQVVGNLITNNFKGFTLIEIGCGKGYFVELLEKLGFDIYGLDPAYEGSNPRITKANFNGGTKFCYEGVILRHVLEHVENPLEFLTNLRDSNGGVGKIYIEVPCLDWILLHRAWFDIFYEHVNYFRISDFKKIFGKINKIGHLLEGQYIYVIADLSTIQIPIALESDYLEFPIDFCDSIIHYAKIIKDFRSENLLSAIWGASSKGVIFALMMMRAGAEVDFVIDINPEKQGKYIASTGLKVQSPYEVLTRLTPGAAIFVMNSFYLEEIKAMTCGRFNLICIDQF